VFGCAVSLANSKGVANQVGLNLVTSYPDFLLEKCPCSKDGTNTPLISEWKDPYPDPLPDNDPGKDKNAHTKNYLQSVMKEEGVAAVPNEYYQKIRSKVYSKMVLRPVPIEQALTTLREKGRNLVHEEIRQ